VLVEPPKPQHLHQETVEVLQLLVPMYLPTAAVAVVTLLPEEEAAAGVVAQQQVVGGLSPHLDKTVVLT
jgi:hypothetical protein